MRPAGSRAVSAIVPARDAAATLSAVLPALLGALPPGAEVLVVDDGSTDDTAALAAGRGARVLGVSEARGPAAARNRGARAAAGGFDESYVRPSLEDVELGYRLTAAGRRIRLVKDAQVTHLKRWTLGSWLVSDLRDRALPWARLVRAGRPLPHTLNFTGRDRAASGLVALAWLLLAGALFFGSGRRAALGGTALALASAVALDAPFLRFAAHRVSPAFALAAGALHLLHRTAGLVGLALGFLDPSPQKSNPAFPPARR